MKKLPEFSVLALITPIWMLGTGSVLTQQFTDQNADGEQQSTQPGQNPDYADPASANDMQARKLIGAKIKTSSGANVGSVNDLIIGENGYVVAIVVGIEELPENESERRSHRLESRTSVRYF